MRIVYALSLLLAARAANAICPAERAPVKHATDSHVSQVRLVPIPATIESLQAIPAPRPLPQDGRIAPAETTIHSVTATLIAYRLTAQSEIVLILSDDARRTIVATIPAPACASGSSLLSLINGARTIFERRYAPAESFREVRQPIEVQGIGFFDFFQGQRGLAPNGLSLYPVTSIDFTPSFPPSPPAALGRRRASRSGGERACTRPSLSITTSRGSACAGEIVTVTWQASDAAARVDIAGIGASLPSSGSRTVTATGSAAYSGRATSSCGTGDEAVAVVSLVPSATASLTGPTSLNSGNTGTLGVTTSGAASWSLTSSLGNPISPSSGTSNSGATYTATRSGTDTVTLTATGGACGSVTRTLVITIVAPTTPPPGPNLGLRCCDGTRSPTCFSCSNKRGCCSGHGGVCDC